MYEVEQVEQIGSHFDWWRVVYRTGPKYHAHKIHAYFKLEYDAIEYCNRLQSEADESANPPFRYGAKIYKEVNG